MVVAIEWASQITTISLEMVAPPLAGYFVDRWLGTEVVFLLLGAVLGLTTGIWHLLKFAQTTSGRGGTRKPQNRRAEGRRQAGRDQQADNGPTQ